MNCFNPIQPQQPSHMYVYMYTGIYTYTYIYIYLCMYSCELPCGPEIYTGHNLRQQGRREAQQTLDGTGQSRLGSRVLLQCKAIGSNSILGFGVEFRKPIAK